MRIPFFVIAALSCVGIGCGDVTNVDDLFTPTPTGGTTGKGGTGGSGGVGPGGTGGSGGSTTGGTGGVGGSATGGVGGTGGTGGGGTGGTGGVGGSSGTGGTGGNAGTAVDSGADVRRDAVDVRDAGRGSIRCGTTTCDPSVAFCCLQSGDMRCLGLTALTCSASTDRLHCDDTADCAAGQICCAAEGSSGNGADAVCTLTTIGCGAPRQMLCDPTVTQPCLGIGTLVCSANSSGIISDYAYCHAP